jgi:hypothetical protein
MKVRIHAPPGEILSHLRAHTAKRSIFNFSMLGERPLFHGEVREDGFDIEWIPRDGALWGPAVVGTITVLDGQTIIDARLRPTWRVLAAAALLLVILPLGIMFLISGLVGAGVACLFVSCAVGGMIAFVGSAALSSLRKLLADIPERGADGR